MPSRLIQISSNEEPYPAVKLYHTSPADRNLRYLTLSHCWGNAQNVTKLTSEHITVFQEDIPFGSLPRTFRDAVKITIGVGFEYLWIDSLCIIQDSKDDWVKESATMGSVYENSVCTIAAAVATDAQGGCFVTRDPLTYLNCKVAGDMKEGILACPADQNTWGVVNNSPLVTRAWVLQERIISPCMVHFGNPVIYWTCLQGQASEFNVVGSGDITLSESRPILGPSVGFLEWRSVKPPIYGRTLFDSLMTADFGPSDIKSMLVFNREWLSFVSEYSKCKLTMGGDKLIAISSIAQRIQQKTKFKYLAGLWKEALQYNLCWYIQMNLQPPPTEYRAPSWSWASREGVVNYWQPIFSSEHISLLADIVFVDVVTHASDLSGTGQIDSASIEIIGSLRKIRSPSFSKWSDIEGYASIHTLYEKGKELERFYLDLPLISDLTQHICLLPLLTVLPHDYQGRDTSVDAEPQWQEICGLVLLAQPVNKCPSWFERIGFFKFYCKPPDFHAMRLFDGVSRKRITIR